MSRILSLFVVIAFAVIPVVAQEIVWQQEYAASLNGEMTCAYSGGFNYARPSLVDIDADGDLDLFVGERYDGVNFIRNDGDQTHPQWTFVEESFVPISEAYCAPAFCDIDADGDQDAFIGISDGTIYFYRNDGSSSIPSWTLETEMFESIVAGPHAIPAFCDIDADDDLDLFIGMNEGNVYFYENQGNSVSYSFAFADSYYVSAKPQRSAAPTFADIDTDGDLDLFVGTHGDLFFFRNEGDATNAVMTLEETEYAEVSTWHNCVPAFADLDNDNDLDIVVGDAFRGLLLYSNIGDMYSAIWETTDEYYATIDLAYPGYPAFADINNDGKPDLFMGSYYEGIYLYANDGTINQEAWLFTAVPMVGQGNIATFCDIDGDLDFDLFCGHVNGTLYFYENEGSAELAVWSQAIENYNNIDVEKYSAPVFCDIDNDGDYDMFVGKEDGTINYYENDGDAFSPQWAVPDTFFFEIDIGSRSMPEFCDIDRDGDFDLFVGGNGNNVSFFRNDGDRNVPMYVLVTDQYASIQQEGQADPVFVDIDGDYDIDMFVGNTDGGLTFWRNMSAELAVEDDVEYGSVPGEMGLLQNYPNPFNPTTDISYQLSAVSDQSAPHTTLRIYNILGQEVRTLVDEVQELGYYTVTWDGSEMASGIYFLSVDRW